MHRPSLKGFWLPLLVAAFMALPRAASAQDTVRIHRVYFKGVVHDMAPRAILVDTMQGSTLVPTSGPIFERNGRAVDARLLHVGRPVNVVVPPGSYPLAAATDTTAVLALPHGPIAVPYQALSQGSFSSSVSVRRSDGSLGRMPLFAAVRERPRGALAPASLSRFGSSLPPGTVFGVVLGRRQNDFLLQILGSNGIDLCALSASSAPGLDRYVGQAVELAQVENHLAVQPWLPGTNAFIRFPGQVERVTSSGVYVKTRTGTVLVPRRAAYFSPAAPRHRVAGYQTAPVSENYPPSASFGPSYPPTYSHDAAAYGGPLLPYADPYAGYGTAPYPDYGYQAPYDYPMSLYPEYAPDSYVDNLAYPAYYPSYYAGPTGFVSAGFDLGPGTFVNVSIPLGASNLEGVVGPEAVFDGPVGVYTVPVAALPPLVAAEPVIVPVGGVYEPVPVGVAASLQLGDFSLSFANFGPGLLAAPALPPYMLGYAEPAPLFLPPTIVLPEGLPPIIVEAPTVVNLPNGEVCTVPFENAVKLCQYQDAIITQPPRFDPRLAEGTMVGVCSANGTVVPCPLNTALSVSQAQSLALADSPALGAFGDQHRVHIRMADGGEQFVPLNRALRMERTQGAAILDPPALPTDLGDRKVRVRLVNGATERIHLRDALALQAGPRAALPADNRFLASTRSSARVGVRFPNGREANVSMSNALRMQRIGAARMTDRVAMASASPPRHGMRGVSLGRAGGGWLVQVPGRHGRSVLRMVPQSRAHITGSPLPGGPVTLRKSGGGLAMMAPRRASFAAATRRESVSASATGFGSRRGFRAAAGVGGRSRAVQASAAFGGSRNFHAQAMRRQPMTRFRAPAFPHAAFRGQPGAPSAGHVGRSGPAVQPPFARRMVQPNRQHRPSAAFHPQPQPQQRRSFPSFHPQPQPQQRRSFPSFHPQPQPQQRRSFPSFHPQPQPQQRRSFPAFHPQPQPARPAPVFRPPPAPHPQAAPRPGPAPRPAPASAPNRRHHPEH